jgi:hypothetical protein
MQHLAFLDGEGTDRSETMALDVNSDVEGGRQQGNERGKREDGE